MKFCEYCGEAIGDDEKNCPHCASLVMTPVSTEVLEEPKESEEPEETGEVEWQPTEEQLLSTM